MSDSYQPNKQRRFRTPSNPWIPYVGDCKAVNNYLESKQGIGWLFPKFLNAFFRGFSQVLFANNPLTGLIILIALLWADLFVGLAAAVAAAVAIIFSVLLKQEIGLVKSGLTTYNAVLVGSVTMSLWTPTFGESPTLKLWALIIVGSIFSVFITSALSNMLSSYRLSLPCLTFPFNVVALLLFTCFMPPIGPSTGGLQNGTGLAPEIISPGVNANGTLLLPSSSSASSSPASLLTNELGRHVRDTLGGEVTDRLMNDEAGSELSITEPTFITEVNGGGGGGGGGGGSGSNNETAESIDAYDDEEEERDPNRLIWGNILSGILLSTGQVYGINDIFSSILIYIAIMIYSPIMCLVSLTGAIIASITGLLFTTAPYTAVYTGLWGFNGILSAAAVGGYFLAMNCLSFWTAVANVLFTVILQQALMVAFHSLRLPVFTLPFVLSTLLFLSVSASGGQLPRVTNFSFPELHRFEYLESRRLNRINKTIQSDIHPEEKELVLKDIKVISDDTPQTPEPEGNGTTGTNNA